MSDIAVKDAAAEDEVDLHVLQDSLGFLTRIAQVHTYDLFFQDLGAQGLRPGEFSTLLLLERNPRIRQGVLAQALRIKPAHMTKLIRAFEDRGLVERIIPDHDRRSVELLLTERGKALIAENRSAFLEHESRMPPSLRQSEVRTLKHLLRKYVGMESEENR